MIAFRPFQSESDFEFSRIHFLVILVKKHELLKVLGHFREVDDFHVFRVAYVPFNTASVVETAEVVVYLGKE